MKGNLFLGYGRGSVGDVVFSRTGGQQVGRARNRKPNNPKTKAQVAQRALFADAVKFYTHGSQSLFRFAFEDKQAQESDYNAFMRINAKNGIMLSPEAISDSNYPAIGNWIMSKGSLTPLTAIYGNMGEGFYSIYKLGVNGSESPDALTVAKLSQYFINTGNFENGDILTFLAITSYAMHQPGESEPILPGDEPPVWHIGQFILDVSDTRYVGAVLESMQFEITKDTGGYAVRFNQNFSSDIIGACAAVHSRKTDGGLKVSTSQLTNSPDAEAAILYAKSTPYLSYIYSAWGASEEAILEGSIANSKK